ncbi:hypothetical protein Hanom_Chr15g01343231 [Helianthus anomalus]
MFNSNQLSNQPPPLDLAEIKSQPLKLTKITDRMTVQGGSLWFLATPPFSAHIARNLQITFLTPFSLPTSHQVTFIPFLL